MPKYFVFVVLIFAFLACEEKPKAPKGLSNVKGEIITHASGFQIDLGGAFPVVTVFNPWPGAEKPLTYAVIPKDKLATITYPKDAYDAVVVTPIENIVVTSTTHIPALESLGALDKLIGFPDTKYVSSMPTRKRISEGKIKELGNNESLNTEMVLEMQPDAIVGFAIDNQNDNYDLLHKSGIPVLFNGDWTEQTPLGKAEWIKFFGVLLDRQQEADSIFKSIETDYNTIKNLAKKTTRTPTVMSGALYKDVWYLPAGDSWAAQFLSDANTSYLWEGTKGTGSLSLSLETVLEKGKSADFWIAPAQFTSYNALLDANTHYKEFQAYQNKAIHTFSLTTGPTGGLLYYELGPQRPDIILKDLVRIFHPELLPDHVPYFFQPLQ